MKYLILIGDGMAGEPLAELDNKTTLESANTPNINSLIGEDNYGQVANVPEGLPPGSDVATLSIFGYDPLKNYTGRGALEAAAMNISLKEQDLCFRCNITHIEKGIMKDFTADHISKDFAAKIIDFLNNQDDIPMKPKFYNGVSYRNLAVFDNQFFQKVKTTPPHDITGQIVKAYLPQGNNSSLLTVIMSELSKRIQKEFADDKLNIWLWGGGGAPKIKPISEKYKIHGTIITAVDLLKGIGRYAGFSAPNIPGATGFIDTDYNAKVTKALDELKLKDFVIVHIEAPDESGHMGNIDYKLQAIEDFDSKVVKPIIAKLEKRNTEFRMLILPDHPTPISKKTHTMDPVPYVFFDSKRMQRNLNPTKNYSEQLVLGKEPIKGTELMPMLLKK